MADRFVSLEMLLDDDAEAAVRAEWEALAEAGHSSLARHTSPSNRPHITMLVRGEVPAVDLSGIVDRPAPEITLGAPLLFGTGDRRVLVRSVVPTAALLRAHADIHDAVGPLGASPLTLPGAWTPHVTLGRRLKLSDLAEALAAIGGPIRGRASGLRLWDPQDRTVTDLGRFAEPAA